MLWCFLTIYCVWGATTAFSQAIDPGTGVKLSQKKSYYPVYSPDGKWIAGCGGFDGVWVTPAAGGTSVKLVGKPTATYNGSSIEFMITRKMGFTPDSREVVYTSSIIDESRGTTVSVWKTAGGNSIEHEIPVLMAADVETHNTRVIRDEALNGRYSTSGRYFGYINYDHRAVTDPANAAHHYAIAVYDSSTGETRYFADDPAKRSRNFSFSSDETSLVAEYTDSGIADGRIHICIFPLDGGSPIDITWNDNPYNALFYSNPEFSPDGRWVLYNAMTYDSSKRMLFAYNTETGKTTSVFPETTVWNTDAAWTPDGKQFCCQLELGSTNNGALYRFDFNEADLGVKPELGEVALYIPRAFGNKLVDFSLDSISRDDSVRYASFSSLISEYSPVWSPDGNTIAFTNQFGATIWTVSAAGGQPVLAANYNNIYDYNGYKITLDRPAKIVYAPDGKRLVFPSGIIDESRGTKVTITEGTTPSGTHFGYGISNPIPVIKELNLETGETGLVLDSAYSPIYSHSGRYLAYSTSSDRFLTIYDTATGESKTLNSARSQPYCFTPDATAIISRVGINDMYRIPLDGSPATKLFSCTFSSADISPDGSLVLFDGTIGGKTGFFVYEVKSGTIYPFLINTDGFLCSEGKFSPDGKKICYSLGYSGSGSWIHTYVRDFNLSDIGIPAAVSESVPSPFALSGNYPNPFNPSTTIGFSLDTPGKVNMAVYSLSGQKVRELISNSYMTVGSHSIVWDGRDERGKTVSSGIYFTRLTRGVLSVSGKMTLMK